MTCDRPVVMHVITGLGRGGAEAMLWKLLRSSGTSESAPMVVTLMAGGELAQPIRALGIPVHALGMARGNVSLSPLFALVRLIKKVRPAVIVGWMYHPSIAALLAKAIARSPASLVWNIRHTPYDLRSEKFLTAVLIRAGAWLSKYPKRIIYNSHVSRKRHAELGFHDARGLVIPNGFDVADFDETNETRNRIRVQLGLPGSVLLVGHVARFHPMKGHASFFRAAREISECMPEVRFLFIGKDVSLENAAIAHMVDEAGLTAKAVLLGERSDVADFLCALDVFCLSSEWGEGFPNILGEAMACGVPCVTTDVGDAAIVVGDAGRVVPKAVPSALADAVCELLRLQPAERRSLGLVGRTRVEEHFSLSAVSRSYQQQLDDLIPV